MKVRQTLAHTLTGPARGYRYLHDLPPLQKLPWIFLVMILGGFGLAPVLEGDVIAGWLVFLTGLPFALSNLDESARTQISDRLKFLGYFRRGLRCRLRRNYIRDTLTWLAETRLLFGYQRHPSLRGNHEFHRCLDNTPAKKQFLIAPAHAFRPPPVTA